MTHRQVAALAIRVLAIYAIINSLGLLQSSLTILFMVFIRSSGLGSNPVWQIGLQFLPFCFFAAMGIGLWILADTLAYFMCGGEDRNAPAVRLPAVEILTLTFGIIGIWFTLSALPKLLSSFSLLLLAPTNNMRIGGVEPVAVALTTVGAQIAIGLFFFFAARSIAQRVAARYRFAPPVSNAVEHDAENSP